MRSRIINVVGGTALEARVRGVNECHRAANALEKVLAAIVADWDGQKIVTATNSLLAKCANQLQPIIDKSYDEFQLHRVYAQKPEYSLRVNVGTCVHFQQGDKTSVYYYDVSIYLGQLDNFHGWTFKPHNCSGDDLPVYSATKITKARFKVESLSKQLSDAKSALGPFGEHDRQ